jgi:N-methylhydantoinase A/oxoprolinase/acetone carboxylase beta subunit
LLAVSAATALDIDRVVVFPQSSVFSAFGGGLLPIAHSFHAAVQDVTREETVSVVLKTLLDRASRDMRAEGVAEDAEVSVTLTLYDFAGEEIIVEGDLRKTVADNALIEFALLGVARPGQLKVDLRVFDDPSLSVRDLDKFLSPTTTRSVQLGGELVEVPVASGLGSPLADSVSGPALLAARDTTIWVPVGWTVEFDKYGYGLISRSGDLD